MHFAAEVILAKTNLQSYQWIEYIPTDRESTKSVANKDKIGH